MLRIRRYYSFRRPTRSLFFLSIVRGIDMLIYIGCNTQLLLFVFFFIALLYLLHFQYVSHYTVKINRFGERSIRNDNKSMLSRENKDSLNNDVIYPTHNLVKNLRYVLA